MTIWKDYTYGGLAYKVSNHGDVIGRRGRILAQHKNSDGYMTVTLGSGKCRDRVKVHRVIAECFIPHDVSKNEVNHKDFNRANNNANNLEWVTHVDNIRYSYAAGRHIGSRSHERNGRSLLTEQDIPVIREMISSGRSNIEIGHLFGVAPSTIWNIKAGNTWK